MKRREFQNKCVRSWLRWWGDTDPPPSLSLENISASFSSAQDVSAGGGGEGEGGADGRE